MYKLYKLNNIKLVNNLYQNYIQYGGATATYNMVIR